MYFEKKAKYFILVRMQLVILGYMPANLDHLQNNIHNKVFVNLCSPLSKIKHYKTKLLLQDTEFLCNVMEKYCRQKLKAHIVYLFP